MHTRREFVAGLSALAGALCLPTQLFAQQRKDVAWLAEIQQKPAKLPEGAKDLPNLLIDDAGQPIKTKESWLKRREQLRTWWTDFLGKMPAERDLARPPTLTILEEDLVGDVFRQRVEYEVEPGIKTEAYLCRPAHTKNGVPGVVCFHSTVDHSIRQPAGLGPDVQKAFGLKFAQQGRIVFSPRNFLWPTNDKISAKPETDKYLARVPKSLGMAKMLYDSLIAVDILAKLPGVDPTRLGAVGHSLGAKEVLYLAAFDERIKCTVSSEGGIGIRHPTNWNAPWYLGAAINEPGFAHDHHELLALCAPRPFLLIGGESADGDRGWPFIEAALPVYKLYGDKPILGQFNHRQGHAVPPIAEQRIEEWFAAYL
jgi:dienelactone hydrolase